MSSLWILEAKAFPEDTRTKTATTVKFCLPPGTYTVGRLAGQCDIDVVEDKSISRTHAHITVPTLDDLANSKETESEPYCIVKDSSRYGTLIEKENNMAGAGSTSFEAKAYSNSYIRFGYNSPFRLTNLNISLILHPSLPPTFTALATSLGLPLATNNNSTNTRLIVRTAPTIEVAGDILTALNNNSNCRLVKASWLEAFGPPKVWKNTWTKEEEYTVQQLTYAEIHGGDGDGDGGRVSSTSVVSVEDAKKKVAVAVEEGLFKGATLVWLTQDVSGKEIVSKAGATIVKPPAAKTKTPKLAADAVVVVDNIDTTVQVNLRGFRKTTPQHLYAGLLEVSLEDVFIDTNTPPSTATKDKATAKKKEKPTPASKKKTNAAAADDGGETTDEELDVPHPMAVIEESTQQASEQQEQPSPSARKKAKLTTTSTAAAPTTATKRKAEQQPERETAEAGPSTATTKRAKKEAATSIIPPLQQQQQQQQRQPASSSKPRELVVLPKEDGWKTAQHAFKKEEGDDEQQEYRPQQQQQQRRQQQQPKVEQPPQEEIKDEPTAAAAVVLDTAAVSYAALIVKPTTTHNLQQQQNQYGDYTGPNFKAFKRKINTYNTNGADAIEQQHGDGGGGNATTNVLASQYAADQAARISYEAEPYREVKAYGGDEFMRAEQDRKNEQKVAEQLFDADNVKAKKAAPMKKGAAAVVDDDEDDDDEVAVVKGGRGGGRKMGTGRGRGRARGRGRG